MQSKKNTHCVQCGREMEFATYDKEQKIFRIPFCHYPECPNYGLLQTPVLSANPIKNDK